MGRAKPLIPKAGLSNEGLIPDSPEEPKILDPITGEPIFDPDGSIAPPINDPTLVD